jgi:hypothetical protein
MPDSTSELTIIGQVTDVVKPQTTAAETINYDTVIIPPQESTEDIITLSIRDDELPDAVLKAVMIGLAEEQQAIKLLREKKERDVAAGGESKGKDTSHLSIKRGTLLKYMSETVLQRQALIGGSGELDLKSPKFREILKLLLTTVSETFDMAKIPPEYKNLFFAALGPNLEIWEQKANKIIKTVH